MASPQLSESEFRKKIQETFNRIEKALENVDPDIAECEQAMGSLTISFTDRSRFILSVQPSVRQLWLALASLGTAYHFDLDPVAGHWIDDKGKGVELLSYLGQLLTERAGALIQL